MADPYRLYPIAKIRIGDDRSRKDLGDTQALAESIRLQGLLQPIGITPDGELVFGVRRVVACRDLLRWTDIPAIIVNVTGIAEGERDENEMRKAFTPSERTAIFRKIERMKVGNPEGFANRVNRRDSANILLHTENAPLPIKRLPTNAEAAKRAGFRNPTQAFRTGRIVDCGIPEVVDALDRGEITVNAAEKIARAPVEDQLHLLAKSPRKGRRNKTRTAAEEKAEGRRHAAIRKRQMSQRIQKITIPWRAKSAARLLVTKWPRDMVEALVHELTKRLSEGPRQDGKAMWHAGDTTLTGDENAGVISGAGSNPAGVANFLLGRSDDLSMLG